MNNMDIWDKVKLPPPGAMKEIKGGRLNGKTDINPQWRIKAMTEIFGPVGIGWGYDINDRWTEAGTKDQLLCFVKVGVWYRNGDIRSEPVVGIGGDFVLEAQSSGVYNNDEAYKMATTDAIGNALKYLGVASEVFEGHANHLTKYDRAPKAEAPEPRKAPPASPQAPSKPRLQAKPIEEVRRDNLKEIIKALLDNPALGARRESVAERARTMAKADPTVEGLNACVIFVQESIDAIKASPELPIF